MVASSDLLTGVVIYQIVYFEAMLNFTTTNNLLVFQAQPVSDEIYIDNVTIIVTAINNFGTGEPSDAVTDMICKCKFDYIIYEIIICISNSRHIQSYAKLCIYIHITLWLTNCCFAHLRCFCLAYQWFLSCLLFSGFKSVIYVPVSNMYYRNFILLAVPYMYISNIRGKLYTPYTYIYIYITLSNLRSKGNAIA